ncbi:hypothetical protein D9613_005297 [Agrocybe pediades]|uniref:E3 ubiquitin-protein ligase RNF220 middle domain-containing protein n=1 Tax=Agrocybe pediades TaxID=84607 RepID=A0A8H4VR86_9AGAR|nr:hypothetical protein D9613_005297 [Agrocybe pediades]
MVLTITLNKGKGKKRAFEPLPEVVPLSVGSVSEPPHPTKRIKRGVETRPCPICDEHVPLRLLAKHAELESARVEEVIQKVGSTEVLHDKMLDEPGPSSRVRRSAVKALKSMTSARHASDPMEQSHKTIETVKRRRKKRYTKLKEMLREEDEGLTARNSWLRRYTGEEMVCPVCATTVRGDRDVLDAHVDACLAHQSQVLENARQQELLQLRAVEEEAEHWEDVDEDGNYVGDVRGAGFETLANDNGVDEEIDIDGDDQAIFGEAQFTENDIVPVNRSPGIIDDEDVDIEDVESAASLQNILTNRSTSKTPTPNETTVVRTARIDDGISEMDRLDVAITYARQRGDKAGLILALENKVKALVSLHYGFILRHYQLQLVL